MKEKFGEKQKSIYLCNPFKIKKLLMLEREGRKEKVWQNLQKDLDKKIKPLTFATHSKTASSFRYWSVEIGK